MRALEVLNEANAAFHVANVAFNAAWVAEKEARAAWTEALEGLWQALEPHLPEIDALHAVECPDCPWHGKTIFPTEVAT